MVNQTKDDDMLSTINSSSTKEEPMARHFAFKNVYAIPPPRIRVSHYSNKFEITFNLSATFAPPKMATNGLTGVSTAFPKKSISFCIK